MKMSKLKNVNSQAMFNILSTTILSGINFLTIPIFTRLLGPTDYGLYSLYNTWVLILTCIMGMETQSGGATARYVFKDDYDGYISSTLFLGTISSAVFIVIGVVFRNFLAGILGFSPLIVVLLFLCAFGHYVVNFSKSIYIYKKRAEINFAVSVTVAIATVVLSFLFIKSYKGEEVYTARAFGASVPYIIAAVILWFVLFLKKPLFYNKQYWSYCLMLGLPIVFHVLANDLLGQSNKVMLQYLGYAGEYVGIYGFIYVFTNILKIILTALNASWTPFYYDDLNDKAFDKLKKKCNNYIELFTVLACGFILLSREVCFLFADKEYWSGIPLVPLMVIAIYFTFMYQFPVNFEFFLKKTKIVAMGTIGAAVLNIIFNFLLIPPFGMYGAAFATCISFLALFAVHYIIASHIKEMLFHIRLLDFIPGLACVLLAVGLFYLLKDFWYVRWVVGVIVGGFEGYRIVKRKSIF